MYLFSAFKKNLKWIGFHLNIWLFKMAMIFLAFQPFRFVMDEFFENRPANETLLTQSDTTALYEFILYGMNSIAGSMIFLAIFIGLLMIVIDALFEAGFIRMYHENKKSAFWDGIRDSGKRLIGLKLLTFIPYLIFLGVMSGVFLYTMGTFQFQLTPSLLTTALVGSLMLFFLKWFDHSKYSIVVQGKTVGKAFKIGIKGIFKLFKQVYVLNFTMMILFAFASWVYLTIDNTIAITSTLMVFVAFVLQQSVVLFRQMFRFTYMGSVIEFLELSKNETVAEELSSSEAFETIASEA